jgi:hypothetical protein
MSRHCKGALMRTSGNSPAGQCQSPAKNGKVCCRATPPTLLGTGRRPRWGPSRPASISSRCPTCCWFALLLSWSLRTWPNEPLARVAELS